MTPAAQVSAAIEILRKLDDSRRPASEALKEWGVSHRFAGSKDRAAIASLVYDALRKRASSAYIMGDETPRAVMLGALREARGLGIDRISALFSGEGHASAPLSGEEREKLETATLLAAPAHVRGDYPKWLEPRLEATFGVTAAAEGAALAARAPLDLRVNILKCSREEAASKLEHLRPSPTPLSPLGLRIMPGLDGRGPALSAEPAFVKGLVETQDEGSQLAALLCGVEPGDQILDLCAGGGGKTLALAAQLHNRGQIYAYDEDGRRLTPMYARLERSGARNVQLRAPRGKQDVLADLEGRCDIVLIDAPCTGTGTWRRHPDAKWRTRARRLGIASESSATSAPSRRAVRETGRTHGLRDLFAAARGKRGSNHGVLRFDANIFAGVGARDGRPRRTARLGALRVEAWSRPAVFAFDV